MSLVLGIALAAASLKLPDPWLTFSRAPAFDRRVTIVEVGTVTGGRPQWNYWFRRTVRQGNAKQVWWADTRRCPDARWIVEEAINITPPRIWMPGVKDPNLGDEFVIIGDGVGYAFSGNAHYNKAIGSDIEFTSNVGTPLAAWVDESLRRLEPCWSKEQPSDG